MPPLAAVSQKTTSRRFILSFRRHTTNHSTCFPGAMGAAAVKEGLRVFFALFGTLAFLAAVATALWFLLFHFALKKLPPVQEALGYKKRDKPSLAEKRGDIEALKAQHRHISGIQQQPIMSAGDGGVRLQHRR
ncbi:hypothetical protein ACK3TF_001793 [Chlorella vulgaris]